jgi:hypothetical protein
VSVLRQVWWGLALAAVVATIWTAASPVSDVSLSCSKTGELGLDGSPSGWKCDDSIVDVLGVWPLIQLGQLLAIPPAVAAIAMRRWVSWLVVALFVVLVFVGIANWSSFWASLLLAVPMAVVGLCVATVQHLIQPPRRSALTLG